MPLFKLNEEIEDDVSNQQQRQNDNKKMAINKVAAYFDASKPLDNDRLSAIIKANKHTNPTDDDIESEDDEGDSVVSQHEDVKLENIEKLLQCYSYDRVDSENTWVRVSWAIKNSIPEDLHFDAYQIWNNWSKQSAKYDEKIAFRKWAQNATYNGPRLGYGSLVKWAQEDNRIKFQELFPSKKLTIQNVTLHSTYDEQKKIFEQSHFWVYNQAHVVTFDQEFNKVVMSLNQQKSASNYGNIYCKDVVVKKGELVNEIIPFFTKWMKDPDRLSYDGYHIRPPGYIKQLWEKNYRFFWPPVAASLFHSVDKDERVLKIFDEYMDRMSDGDEKDKKNILDFITHALKYPHIKPRKMMMFVSFDEGTGKGTLFNIITEIFGMDLVSNISHYAFQDDKTDYLTKNFFLLWDEVELRQQDKAKLYNLITESIVPNRNMYASHCDQPSFLRIIGTSNNVQALKLNEGQRRCEVYKPKPFDCQQDASNYFSTYIYPNLFGKSNIKVIYDFLCSREVNENISGVPDTKWMRENKETSIDPIGGWFSNFILQRHQQFNEDEVLKISLLELYKNYSDYVNENSLALYKHLKPGFGNTFKSKYDILIDKGYMRTTKPQNNLTFHMKVVKIYNYMVQYRNLITDDKDEI